MMEIRGYSENMRSFPAMRGYVSQPVLIAFNTGKFSLHFRRCAGSHCDTIMTATLVSFDWIFFPATGTGVPLKPL